MTKESGYDRGVNLSYLSEEEQKLILKVMDSQRTDLSVESTSRLRKMSMEGELGSEDVVDVIVKSDSKKRNARGISIDGCKVKSFFPEDTSENEIWDVIYRLLEHWSNGEYGDV